MNLAGLHSATVLHADARRRDGINCHYTRTTYHTGVMSADATSSLHFARQGALSATDESFQSRKNPMDTQQPPPHVVDYWFDRLGLSLDPTSENPLNVTSSAFQFPRFDVTSNVSLLFPIVCCVTFCFLRGVFLIGFH